MTSTSPTTTDEQRSDAAHVGDQLVRVTKLLHVARNTLPRRHPSVDPAAYPLLHRLWASSMRVSALAEAVHSDTSTVSRQVSTLVDGGLVTRIPDPEDGRAHLLSLTEEGHDLLVELRRGRDAWLEELLTDWTDDEVRHFSTHLQRFASTLEASLFPHKD